MSGDAVRQWLDWAAWAIGPDPEKQWRAATAAMAAEAAGLSFTEACERAREAAGLPRLHGVVSGGPAATPTEPVGEVPAPAMSDVDLAEVPERRRPRRPAGPTPARRSLPPIEVHQALPKTAVWVALGALLCLIAAIAYATVAPTTCSSNADQLRTAFVSAHDAAVPPGNRAIAALNECSTVECARPAALQLATAFDDFNASLRSLCFPGGQQADADALIKANSDVSATARAVAASTTTSEAGTAIAELGTKLRIASDAAITVEDDLGITSS